MSYRYTKSKASGRASVLLAVLLTILLGFGLYWQLFMSEPAVAPIDAHRPPPTPHPTGTPLPPPGTIPPATTTAAPHRAVAMEWPLTLINAQHTLAPDFVPDSLQRIDGGMYFDARACDALAAMLAAARAEGLSPIVCSAYRNYGQQTAIHQRLIRNLKAAGYSHEQAVARASQEVAPPGASEHQLGLAVDIVAANYQRLDAQQANTAEAQWLREHCAEYGFILRYTAEKSAITGIIDEPWHFRYVGVTAAREITDSGVCLEEYLGGA